MKMYKISKNDIASATSHGDKTDFELFKQWIDLTEVNYYGWVEFCLTEMQFKKLFNLKEIKEDYVAEENRGKWFDHARAYRNTKTDKSYIVSHLYYPKQESLMKLFEWCDKNGLEATILPYSWYYPNVTTAVQITKKEQENES